VKSIIVKYREHYFLFSRKMACQAIGKARLSSQSAPRDENEGG